MSHEEQQDAESVSLERERIAFDRVHAAWIAVQNQFIPFGNGMPTQGSIDEYYAAESDWQVAQAEVKRFSIEIMAGHYGNHC